LSDPRQYEIPEIELPDFDVDDNLVIYPPEDGSSVEVVRGPNIAPLPEGSELAATLTGEVLLKVEDDITTDHIMPAGKYLPLRSNVPEYAKHVFEPVDPDFYDNAKAKGGGFVVGGHNYGQGSSREHAALCPMYLGVKAVVVKSFARIHLANLVNFGILPITFDDPADYDDIDQGDTLDIDVTDLASDLKVVNTTKGHAYSVSHSMSAQDMNVVKAGGKLAYVKRDM
jgi:aconitate hydratase